MAKGKKGKSAKQTMDRLGPPRRAAVSVPGLVVVSPVLRVLAAPQVLCSVCVQTAKSLLA